MFLFEYEMGTLQVDQLIRAQGITYKTNTYR